MYPWIPTPGYKIKPPKQKRSVEPSLRLPTPPKPRLVHLPKESGCKYVVTFDDRLTIKQDDMERIASLVKEGLDEGFVSLPKYCSLIIIKENGDVERL